MNKLFAICFVLFPMLYEMENDQNWYRKFVDDQRIGIPTSLITGGLMAVGLKYLSTKNRFFSSFPGAEKIKKLSYFKSFTVGIIGTIGFYELLKGLTPPNKNNSSNNSNLLETNN